VNASIRFAQTDDAHTLHRFICALAEYEREPDAVEVGEDELRAQLASDAPPFECLLAEVAGEPVGFALFFHNYSTWRGRLGIHLEDLFVSVEERGKGYGGALLGRLAQLTVERGGARLEWAVLDWNQPAIEFYQQLGANPQDEWTTHRLDGEALAKLAASAAARA
jgi:GNAT superfamily N-acetyltransferase